MDKDKEELTELSRYILALCEVQNLSMRQGSERSGLDPTTISKIVQRDGRSVPRPGTLERLAEGLNGDYLYMMGLAGHLAPVDQESELDAELATKFKRLRALVRQVAENDLEGARRLMSLVITPFEIMLSQGSQVATSGYTLYQTEEAKDAMEGVGQDATGDVEEA